MKLPAKSSENKPIKKGINCKGKERNPKGGLNLRECEWNMFCGGSN